MPARPTRRWSLAALAVSAALALSGCSAADPGTPGQPGPPTSTAGGVVAVAKGPVAARPDPTPVIAVSPALGTTDFAPNTPVRVESTGGRLTGVTLARPDGSVVAGTLSADRTGWQSNELLGYDRSYTVRAAAVTADGRPATVEGSITTVVPSTLTYASMIPNPQLTHVGVGQPIAVYFDENVTDRAAVQKSLVVTSTPPVRGAWHWFSDREVHFRPENFWPAHTRVAVDVNIYGVDLGGGIFGQEDRHIQFDVGDSMIAEVSNDGRQLRAYRNGQLVRTMPTSLGKDGTQTPSGTYTVMDQHAKYTMDSSTYGVPIGGPDGYRTVVEYASRLSDSGIFVHGAPWSVADQGVRNVSHGCLNVSVSDAQWFYDNFGRGDVVRVTGTDVPLAPTDGFGDWNLSWADWTAGSPVG